MNEFDVEEVRLTPKAKETLRVRDEEIQAVKVVPRKKRQMYLASVPLGEPIATARRLGANPLMLYLLINTLHTMMPGGEWIRIPRKMLDSVGLRRQREYEAAGSLEAAGLIVRRSKAGCKNMYKLNSN